MEGVSLPPGFRFHPTDQELVGYYLKRKIDGLEIELEVIPVIHLYKFDPWELPDKSFLPKRDMEWYFFCPWDKKYPNGSRTNRATKAGYWKATGKDKKIICQSLGYRKTLVFYRGRAPLGDRTNWVMHEYRLCNGVSQGIPSFQEPYALCRIIKRNDQTQKASDVYGEPKTKQVQVGSSSSSRALTSGTSNETVAVSNDMPYQANYICNKSIYSSSIPSPYQITSVKDYESNSLVPESTSLWDSPDFVLDSSKEYTLKQGVHGYFPHSELSQSMTSWNPCDQYQPADNFSFGSMEPYSGNGNFLDSFWE